MFGILKPPFSNSGEKKHLELNHILITIQSCSKKGDSQSILISKLTFTFTFCRQKIGKIRKANFHFDTNMIVKQSSLLIFFLNKNSNALELKSFIFISSTSLDIFLYFFHHIGHFCCDCFFIFYLFTTCLFVCMYVVLLVVNLNIPTEFYEPPMKINFIYTFWVLKVLTSPHPSPNPNVC